MAGYALFIIVGQPIWSFCSNSAPPPQESSVDRISSLPDTLLSHILSFLLTKDAVATSVLSSRWKFLWRNTSSLSFCCTHYPPDDFNICGKNTNTRRFMKFLHFVNRTLLLHDSKCIDKFSLDVLETNVVYDYNTRELVMSWVTAAVARRVKVIVLVGRRSYHVRVDLLRFDLPSCVYTCKSLQVLHLCGVVVLHPFGVVSLPNLHTLRLEEVRITGDESLSKLVSGCSSLKTLYVLRGCEDEVVTFTVCSPTLEHLTITTCDRENDDVDEDEEKYINLELDVPALKYLHLHDEKLNDISMEDMPSLVEAKLSLNRQFFNNQRRCKWNGIVNILRSLCLVKALTLDVFILMAIRYSGLSPRFPRLTNLTLKTACCQWSSLQDFLEGSESLEYLTLNLDFKTHRHETCWTKPNEMPACLSCLKEMSIQRFSGRDDELALLGYILGNSTLLKIMTITASSCLNLTEKYQLLQQVAQFRRLSKMCEVIFQ